MSFVSHYFVEILVVRSLYCMKMYEKCIRTICKSEPCLVSVSVSGKFPHYSLLKLQT